eukprot:scpid56504/ scgid31417/ 
MLKVSASRSGDEHHGCTPHHNDMLASQPQTVSLLAQDELPLLPQDEPPLLPQSEPLLAQSDETTEEGCCCSSDEQAKSYGKASFCCRGGSVAPSRRKMLVTRASTRRLLKLKLVLLFNVTLLGYWQMTLLTRRGCQSGNTSSTTTGETTAASDDNASLLEEVEREIATLQREVGIRKRALAEMDADVRDEAAGMDSAGLGAITNDDGLPALPESPTREASALHSSQTQASWQSSSHRAPQTARSARAHTAQHERMNKAALSAQWSELVSWATFNATHYFEQADNSGAPPLAQGTDLTGSGGAGQRHTVEVDLLLTHTLSAMHGLYSRRDFVEGLARTIRPFGTQYELFFRRRRGNPEQQEDAVERVRVMRSLGRLEARSLSPVSENRDDVDTDSMITGTPNPSASGEWNAVNIMSRLCHFLVTVSSRRDVHHLRHTMQYFTSTVLLSDEARDWRLDRLVSLSVVVVTMDAFVVSAATDVVRDALRDHQDFSRYYVVRVSNAGDWRSSVLTHLQSVLVAGGNPHDTVITMDTHYMPTAFSLNRCRAVADAGRRAYSPIAFQLYNPVLNHGMRRKKVSGARGFWEDRDHGVLCLAWSDMEGALQHIPAEQFRGSSFAAPPSPSLVLYRHLLATRHISVIRAPDRGMFRPHRITRCEMKPVQNPVEAQRAEALFDECRMQKARTEGTRRTIAELVFGEQKVRDLLLQAETAQLRHEDKM